MGQTISAVVDKFDDDSAKQKLADDALNSLLEMAKLQVSAFKLAISNPNFDAKLIPIEKILSSESVIQANIQNTPTNVGGVIKDAFSAFANGPVVDGIATLINSGLKVLLGSYSGNTSTRDTYLISTGTLGGVYRVDIHFFAYRFRSDQLKDVTKEVLAVSVVISSAELKGLSNNTLRNIVQQTYGTSTNEEQEKIFQQIKTARDEEEQPADSTRRREFRRAMAKMHTGSLKQGASETSSKDAANKSEHHARVSEMFSIRTPIGEAQKQCHAIEAMIRGGIVTIFGDEVRHVSVMCVQSHESTSDSLISGEVDIIVPKGRVGTAKERLARAIAGLLRSSTDPDVSNLTVDSFVTPADKAGFHQFEWVKDHIPSSDRLARSSAPNYQGSDSDQRLTDDSITFLKDNKIEHVISLNSKANNDTIKKKLKDNNIEYTPLPVTDFTAPTLAQLKKGNDEYKKHRCGTLVWCGYGHGRTGTMVSALQIYSEQERDHPTALSVTDYKKNHVEKMHNGKSTGQYEVLDNLQKELAK
ncbi:hypothetical protein GGR58DRAFT_509588 [Xylaria digitata]|nr:hypothetical protein GGR58DRAFT_509588 [Xylaria digitata]